MKKQIWLVMGALALAAFPRDAHAVAAGDLVIREFRLRGPASSADEYIVIHNRTASDVTVAAGDASAGFGVASSNGSLIFTIPNGTVIPARGHYLGVNTTGFSLGVPYNAAWTADIADGLGLALFDSANTAAFGSTATTIDAVGVGSSASPYLEGTALTAITSAGQHAWVRKVASGAVQDTNANSSDFVLIATDGAVYNSVQSILGAPSPSNTANRDVLAGVTVSLVEPAAGANDAPNRVRVYTPVDRFELRRRITNNTGAALGAIRIRVVDITTLNSPGYATPTQADLRPTASDPVSITATSIGVTSVAGLGLLTPPTQSSGGGWNSILTVPGGPLVNGASIDVNIALAISREGTETFTFTVETAGTLPVVQPVMDPVAGAYGASQSVSLSTPTVGAEIRYTTNGATPTSGSTLYTGAPVSISETTTLKAIGLLTNWADSAVSSATYTLSATAPAISPDGGVFQGVQSVAITTSTEAPVDLWYTLDGSTPISSAPSLLYAGPFNVSTPLTLKASAFKTGWTSSGVSSAAFVPTVATPVFAPSPGTYTTSQAVTITTATAGATIHYTTDGSPPTVLSPVYSGPVNLTQTTTLKAAAFLAGWADSLTAQGAYTIKVADPVLSAPGGIYTTRRNVVVTTSTPGAVIRYTTNGAEPTETDTSIASGGTITVTTGLVLKAKAFKAGLVTSATVRADYLITGAVSMGTHFTLFLREDGTVWSTGINTNGQLGLGNTTQRQVPTQIPETASFHSIKAVAAGSNFSLFLKEDGTVWATGVAAVNGSGAQATSPVQVTTITVPIVRIAAGENHAIALDQTGRIWTWGNNSFGQLGTGNKINRTAPCNPSLPPCLPSLDQIVGIAGGNRHSLVLLADGTVKSWGGNASGELGVGTRASNGVVTPAESLAPTTVSLPSPVSSVRADNYLSLVVTATGEVWSWGDNERGAGGRAEPFAQVPAPGVALSNQRLIATGLNQGYAASFTGPIWAWGMGNYGSLGDGTTNIRVVPGPTLPVPSRHTIEAGTYSAAAITMAGEVYVWGYNSTGQLGLNNTTQVKSTPLLVPDPAAPATPFLLVSSPWLLVDDDGDGLSAGQELMLGLDPFSTDSNGDGTDDGTAYLLGGGALSTDPDGDGLPSLVELGLGTNPYVADTDGDTVPDNLDVFPLDPTRSAAPTPNPNDQTPPVITLVAPTGAQPIP